MTTLPGETGAGSAPASSTDDGGPLAVHVRGLAKAYSGVRAVNGIDLDIRRGEIFALLGPNGAGRPPRSRSSRGTAPATTVRWPCSGTIPAGSGPR